MIFSQSIGASLEAEFEGQRGDDEARSTVSFRATLRLLVIPGPAQL
jgi:hypothetical protein